MAVKGHVLGTSFLKYEQVLESPEAQDKIGSGPPPGLSWELTYTGPSDPKLMACQKPLSRCWTCPSPLPLEPKW